MLKELSKLSQALSAIRVLDATIPVQTIIVFLEIARREGISVGELSTKCGLGTSAASRNVAALSDEHWIDGRKGLGLVVAETDPTDARRTVVLLKGKGKLVVEQISAIMEREY